MGMFTSILLFAIVALNDGVNCGNVILGTVTDSGHSEFGGGSAQHHYSNENGAVSSYAGTTNYEQLPNGKCVKRVVEVIDGISNVKELTIDCAEAKREIESVAKKTGQKIYRQQEKMMNQHNQAMDNIEKKMNEMRASMPKFF